MRYNNKYNMMEPVYKASSSRVVPKDPRRYAPKLSAPSPLVAKSTEVKRP